MGSGTSSDPAAPRGLRAAIDRALPKARYGDHLTILGGTGQNIAGLAVYVLATFGTNILISRSLGAGALGVVVLATQFAFVAGAATRFGMDMAAVRLVAIETGRGQGGALRGVLDRAAMVAAVASAVVAGVVFGFAGSIASMLGGKADPDVFRAAAVAIPFVALCQVYLGGTRGLKVMRYTLYVYWAGQPVLWIALLALGWTFARTAGEGVWAYAGSWIVATVAAWWVWERSTARLERARAPAGTTGRLVRYGAPRAPASLLAQLLFWTDYFVLSRYATGAELGVYAAAIRLAQALVLFLVAVNYMFSPYVADLHERGERDRLNGLYQSLTRWMVTGTMPMLLALAIVPGPALRLFGSGFQTGSAALRILLIGQFVNVATGSVGFILVMAGRTVWDLVVYAVAFALDVAIAFALAPTLGARGAAVAQMVALVVSNGLGLYLVWRFVHIQPFNRHYLRLIGPTLLGAAVMAAAHLGLRHSAWPVDLLGSAVAGTLAYAGALLAFGLAPAERRAAAAILGRGRPTPR